MDDIEDLDDYDIDDIFPAKITLGTFDVTSGNWLYDFVEQSFDNITGLYEDAPGGRTGDHSTGPFLVELNNQDLYGEPSYPQFDLPIFAWVRLRGIVKGDVYYEFQYDPHDASPFTKGLMNTKAQAFIGKKSFDSGIEVTNDITDSFSGVTGIQMSDVANALADSVGTIAWFGGQGIPPFTPIPPPDEILLLAIQRIPTGERTSLQLQGGTATLFWYDTVNSVNETPAYAVINAAGFTRTGITNSSLNGLHVDGGLLTGGSITSVAWGAITGTPTTLSGYGITAPLPPDQGGSGLTTLFGIGAPSAGIGSTGSIYFDVSNPLNPAFYWRS